MEVDIKDNSQALLDELKRKKNLTLSALGETVEKYAKKGCPVDTGRLRNSITYATGDFKGESTYKDEQGNMFDDGAAKSEPKEDYVYIGTNVEYAEIIEENHESGKHYLRNAVYDHKEELKTLAKKIMS